jgi:GT2 family glycosyltransferase
VHVHLECMTPSMTNLSIIIVPREGYCHAEKCLRHILSHTTPGYELIYVAAGAPRDCRNRLRRICQDSGFTFIERFGVVPPNQCRSLGVERASRDYLVFVDNDVFVSDGWLDRMLSCQKQHNAAVTVPMTCQGFPLHQEIHYCGGLVDLGEFASAKKKGEYWHFQGVSLAHPDVPKQAFVTELAEFHCVLVSRVWYEKVGGLNPDLVATAEHIDFSLTIIQHGGLIYCEPTSVVTYAYPELATFYDCFFYCMRWSDYRVSASLKNFYSRWNIPIGEGFKQRMKKRSWRRHTILFGTLLRKLPRWVGRLFVFFERSVNLVIAISHEIIIDLLS